jgi:hypothetical protein
MANEFIIREGFLSNGSTTVTGSLIVTSGITGSLNTASYAFTASYTTNALSASITTTITSASYSTTALSSSYSIQASNIIGTVTASYLLPQNTTTLSNIILPGTASIGGILYPFNSMTILNIAQFNAVTNAQGTIYLTPIAIQSSCVPIKLGVVANTSLANAGRITLGIYSGTDRMLPDALLTSASILNIGTIRTVYTGSVSNTITLQKDQIYWLAMVMSGSAGGNSQNSYATNNFISSTSWFGFTQNRLFNPLLGVQIPINTISLRQVAYYTTSSANQLLPTTLPNTTSSYTVLAYNSRSTQGGNNAGSVPFPPLIFY